MKDNAILDKSFNFALRTVKLYKYLTKSKNEYILSKQLIRSGTSIGANVSEAVQAQSKADFISKLGIALKEASETKYWLKLLYASEYLEKREYDSIVADATEIEKLLVSIIKTTKINDDKESM